MISRKKLWFFARIQISSTERKASTKSILVNLKLSDLQGKLFAEYIISS